MNLHGIVAPYIGAVNPLIPVVVRMSSGPSAPNPAAGFARENSYETPGAITASIADDVLTVTAVSSGFVDIGQIVAGVGVTPGTSITALISGTLGGPGTYRLDRVYTAPVGSIAMTTSLVLMAQVQPITWRDLQQLDGLNLAGERRKIYLHGSVYSVSKVKRKGGDLVTIADGVDRGVWLIVQVLEQFPDWVSAAMTLQSDAP